MGSATSYQENIDSNPYQNIQYIVNASPNDPQNSMVYSNVAEIIFRSNVMFPNAFTPNGDGLNDIFIIESQYIQQINMRIFNRWGELIFQTEELDEGWDGTIKGEPAPMATYLYIVQLTDEMGISFVKKGELVLLR